MCSVYLSAVWFSDGLWDVLSAESSHSENVAELIGMYLERDPEVYEQNAATMLIRRAIGEGWDGSKTCSDTNY